MAYKINNKTEIVFAHEGENNAREIRFDVSGYPDGIIYLELLRYGDSYAYPITLDCDGNEAVWLPDSIATAKRGTGRGQLVVMADDEVVYKSDVFKAINRYSLATTDEVPDGYDSWIQRLETLGADIEGKTTDGLNAINEAKDSALDRISTVSADGIEAINTAKTQGVSAVNEAKTDSLDAIERKKDAVHTELDGYVAEHHDELKGEKGDAYVVTEEDLKEIGDRVEAEYEPNLNALKEEVSHKAEATDLALANRKIKALTDVLNGKELAFETNEYEGNVEVPSGAVADSVLKIGGHSRVSKNLINIFDANESTANGITFSRKSGVIKMKGTSTKGFNLDFSISPISIKGNTDYVLSRNNTSAYPSNIWFSLNNDSNAMVSKAAITKIVRLETDRVYDAVHVWIDSGVTIDLELYLMLEKGTTATDYEPYFEGIVSSQTDAASVRGGNLFDYNNTELGRAWNGANNSSRAINRIPLTVGATYTISGENGNCDGVYRGTMNDIESFPNGVGELKFPYTFTATTGALLLAFNKANIGSADVGSCMIQIERGSVATPYKPYSLTSYPANLPEMKSAGTVHDEVEYNVTFKNMKSVDLGSLDWVRQSSGQFRTELPNKVIPTSAENRTNGLLCSRFFPNDSVIKGTNIDKAMSGNAGTNYVFIYDFEFSTAEAFKSAMQGVILYYEATEGGEDYTTNVLHERVGSVDLGTLLWEYNATYERFISQAIASKKSATSGAESAVLTDKYMVNHKVFYFSANASILGDKTISECASTGHEQKVIVCDLAFTDVTALKASLDGVILHYELATERIKELPNLPSLEAINVESGGQLTFVDHSDLAMLIPSTHEWVVRNEEV